jgi:proline iminopeptidase
MHGGMGFDHAAARPWIDLLGNTMRLIYYDHRGNGRSGRPPLDETITYEQLAADADALRAHLGHERIAVLGLSAGGAVALHYALLFPQHVSHLILVGTHAAWDYGEEISAQMEQRQPTPEMVAAFRPPPPATDAEYAQMVETIMPLFYYRFDPEANHRFLQNVVWSVSGYTRYGELLRNYNIVHRLGEIQVPALVIVGRDDFITPVTQAERLQRGLPNAELVIFEESGHMPYIEETERFREVVRAWLAG